MANCTKKSYASEAEALAVLELTVATAKRTGKGGKSYKRLNAYKCQCCGLWHLGRANEVFAPPVKGPTAGELRRAEKRKAKRDAERAAHDALYADYTDTLRICRMLVDREISRMEALGVPKRTAGTATVETPAQAMTTASTS